SPSGRKPNTPMEPTLRKARRSNRLIQIQLCGRQRHELDQAGIDRFRLSRNMSFGESVNVAKRLQRDCGVRCSRPASVKTKAMRLTRVRDHFERLARGAQLGNKHFGVESVDRLLVA